MTARCPRCFARENLVVWHCTQESPRGVQQVLRCGSCPAPERKHHDWIRRKYNPMQDNNIVSAVPLQYLVCPNSKVAGLCFDCGKPCDMTHGYGEMKVPADIMHKYHEDHSKCCEATYKDNQTVIFCPLCYHNWYTHQKPLVNTDEMYLHLCVYWTATKNGQMTHTDTEYLEKREVIYTV